MPSLCNPFSGKIPGTGRRADPVFEKIRPFFHMHLLVKIPLLAFLLQLTRRVKHWSDRKWGVLSRFVQFCFVGGSGMVFDLGAYKLLLAAAIPVPGARALAIWVAMSWNYAINRRLTFHDSRKEGVAVQYMKFAAACGLGAAMSWSISVGLDYQSVFFNEHKLYAAIVGIVVGTLSNFLISWLWVFRRGEKREALLDEAAMPEITPILKGPHFHSSPNAIPRRKAG
jgi:putative flippase GtrA